MNIITQIEENIRVLERLIAKYGFYRSMGNIIESEKSQLKAKQKNK